MNNTYLQLITIEDAPQLFQIIQKNKASLLPYFPGTVEENSSLEKTQIQIKDQLEQQKAKKYFPYGIFQNNELIGLVQIKNIDWRIPKCELGYFIDQKFGGQGITTKMVGEAVKICFEILEIKKIFLRIDPENIGSNQIAIRNGFELEGVLRMEFKRGGTDIIDTNYYGLINEEPRK